MKIVHPSLIKFCCCTHRSKWGGLCECLEARDLLEYVRGVVVAAVRTSSLIAWSALINVNRAGYFLFVFIVDIQMVPWKFSSAHASDKAPNALSVGIHCVSQPTQSHGRIIPAFFYDELLHGGWVRSDVKKASEGRVFANIFF